MRNGVRYNLLLGLLVIGVCASLSTGFAAKQLSTDSMEAVFGGCDNKKASNIRPCNMINQPCVTVEDCMPTSE